MPSAHGALCVLFFENLHGHIVDGRVVEDYDTAVGTRLDVETAVFTEFIVVAAVGRWQV